MPKIKRNRPIKDKEYKHIIPKSIEGPIILEPKCMVTHKNKEGKYSQQAAVTNRGHLIPCCWMDEKATLSHPIMQNLLKVSKINEHDTIEDIIFSKEWIEFAKNLAEGNIKKVLPACIHHCRKRTEKDKLKKETYFDKDGKIIIKNIV